MDKVVKFGHIRTWVISLKSMFYCFNLVFSLRILISLICTTFIPWYLDSIALVIPMTLGVMAAAVTDIDDTALGRIRNLLITSVCFLISSVSVELLFPYFWLFLIGLILSTFLFTIIGILGPRFAVIAFGSLLIACYTMIGYHMYNTFFLQPLYLLIGVLIYNAIALLESLFHPIQGIQTSLFTCFYELSTYLNCKSALFDPDEQHGFKRQTLALTEANRNVIHVLNQNKTKLFYRLGSFRNRIQYHGIINYYFVAQDIHERASSSHVQYQILAEHFKHSDLLFRFARILSKQALACADLANSIRIQQTYQHNIQFKSDFVFLREAIEQVNTPNKEMRLLVHSLWNLFHNLQAIDALLANINKAKTEMDFNHQYEPFTHLKLSFKQKISVIKK